MESGLEIRLAGAFDLDAVSSILLEAAGWLEASGMPMWRADELCPEQLTQDVADGLFFLAVMNGESVGTIRFQLSDPEFWPDQPGDESAYLHRLAVRRQFAGGGVSSALLAWAVGRAGDLGRRYLRLDCEVERPRLRAIYEAAGFEHHSDRQVGPYFVSRYQLVVTRHGR
jgi:GNAT superfamily N-acetyltransferase